MIVGVVAVAMAIVGTTHASAATRSVTVYVTPAVGESYAALSCGWHETCISPYPSGVGLDWNDDNGTVPVSRYTFFRVRTYANSGSTNSYVGSVKLKWRQGAVYGNCNEVLAEVRRPADFQIQATVRFLHVKRWDEVTYGLYGNGSGILFKTTSGTMIDDSNNGCGWKGFHTHVWHTGNVAVIGNGNIPNANACGNYACTGRYANPASQWDRRFSYYFTY